MKTICAVLTLTWLAGLGVGAFAQEGDSLDAKKELGKAIDKLLNAKSYSFDSLSKSETDGGWGGREGRGREPSETKGKYHVEIGVTGETGGVSLARSGDRIAYTDEAGNWKVADKPSQGNEENPGDWRSRWGQGGRDWRSMRHLGFDAPHKSLKGLADQIDSIEVADDTEKVGQTDCIILKGKLTEAGAELLMSGGDSGRRWGAGGGGEDGGVERTVTGTARFWVNDGWEILKVETVAEMSIDWGMGPMNMSQTRTVTYSKIDETEVEIPRRAQEAFEKAKEKKESPEESPKE
jgi:hypothetical protein